MTDDKTQPNVDPANSL